MNHSDRKRFGIRSCGSRELSGAGLLLLLAASVTAADLPADFALPPAPGSHVSISKPSAGFRSGTPIIATTYFYWYESGSKAHLVDGDGTDALTDHPPTLRGFSYLNLDWHAEQLRDMVAAGIDVALPVYWGDPLSKSWSNAGLPTLVAAREQLEKQGKHPPKFGMFYDTSTLAHNAGGYHVDLRTSSGRLWFYGTIRNFFSLIPARHRVMIDGKPLVFLYAPAFAAGVDDKLFPAVRTMFRHDFGTDIYLVKMQGWPGKADSVYMWGGAIHPQYLPVTGIGPGYDHSAVPGRKPLIRNREGGLFYRRAWERLLARPANKRSWLVHLETWNEFHEGTDLCHSKEYGRKYIELTRLYADSFHARRQMRPVHLPPVPKQISGTPDKPKGIRIVPKPEGDGAVVKKRVAGTTAWSTARNKNSPNHRYLYFDVDDNFLTAGDEPIAVTVTYYDDGPRWFLFEYDSADSALTGLPQRFRPGYRQAIRGSRHWRTVSFVVPHARFSGRVNGADFRFACDAGDLVIGAVSMRRAKSHQSGKQESNKP